MELLPKKYLNIKKLLKDLKSSPEKHWVEAGEKRALTLFHEASHRVPAYKDFLKKNGVNPKKIKTISDFEKIPQTDKKNYLRRYSFADLSWDGKFSERRWVIASTSGSTGEPFYFPRERWQDLQYAGTAELYLLANFNIHKKSTLYVNCFALGVWIGGIFTYEAIKTVAERGRYKLSVINPGLNKAEAIKAVKALGKNFDQILVGGYPPFVKDLVDEGLKSGLKWRKYNPGFIFSAEAFSESFRDYIIEKAGVRNQFKGTLNHFGTVDQGTLAVETPLAILIRKIALKNRSFYDLIFRGAQRRLPTLAQYDPELFYFEEKSGGLFCTAASGFPLIRYDLKDYGGVISFEHMLKNFSSAGIDFKKEVKRAGISDTIWELPFVYVYERKDLSATLYGLNIYPETVRLALQTREFMKFITGKFSMLTKTNKKHDQYLEINIELVPGIKGDAGLKKRIGRAISEKLLEENSEYRELSRSLPKERTLPKILFWPYEYPLYFSGKGKQKWVIK